MDQNAVFLKGERMITGNKVRKIKRYLPMSHGGDVYGWVQLSHGWSMRGIPYQWHSDNSMPFIEVVDASGNVVRTVNALDCSEIEFDDTEAVECQASWQTFTA